MVDLCNVLYSYTRANLHISMNTIIFIYGFYTLFRYKFLYEYVNVIRLQIMEN